jgi:hypothetical protein
MPVASTKRRISSSAPDYATPLPIARSGRCKRVNRSTARSIASGAANVRGAGLTSCTSDRCAAPESSVSLSTLAGRSRYTRPGRLDKAVRIRTDT